LTTPYSTSLLLKRYRLSSTSSSRSRSERRGVVAVVAGGRGGAAAVVAGGRGGAAAVVAGGRGGAAAVVHFWQEISCIGDNK
jgi:hypothetical protein